MYNHEPKDYFCPMCMVVAGRERGGLTRQAEVFYRDNQITAWVNLYWWPGIKGNSSIVPNEHYENIYEIPDDLLARIQVFSKRLAIAYKEVLKCDGVSMRQHNEPAGNQHEWHYHLHVLPRWEADRLYLRHEEWFVAPEEERVEYAKKLRGYFENEPGQ